MSFLFLIAACTEKKSVDPVTMTPEQLSTRGEAIYQRNCIACHNVDPKKEGSVGPAIAGSSLDLVKARVLKAEYPPGYKPKRTTKLMPALWQLESEIPALHAYLNH